MDKAALELKLQELTVAMDEDGLKALVNSLQPEEKALYKTELAATWYHFYAEWYIGYTHNKVQMSDPHTFFTSLMEMLAEAEQLDPDIIYYSERADCYRALAELITAPADKLQNINKAIQELTAALTSKGPSALLYNELVAVLLDKIVIRNQFTEEELTAALLTYEKALTLYTGTNMSSLLHEAFRLLRFPFVGSWQWHHQFVQRLTTTLTTAAATAPIVYLHWSNELARIVQYEFDYIPKGYQQELARQSIALLQPLTAFETDDAEHLNQLGNAFERAAKYQNDVGGIGAGLPYYEVALKYFTKGQQINPAAWTFPVYATNVLKAMAHNYHQLHNSEKVKALFEAGRVLFANMLAHEKDFTINLYWGEYLIAYARLVYNFKAPAILEEAAAKFTIAKTLGRNYYSQPYVGLAIVTLKLGDREKSLAILRECKTTFSTEYYQYSVSDLIRDPDFLEIQEEIVKMEKG